MATLPYPLKLHPRIEDYAVIAGRQRTVPLLGIDMLSESLSTNSYGDKSDATVFERNDSIWVGSGLGYKVGDHLTLTTNDRSSGYTVRGILGGQSDEVIVMDLAQATRILRPTGRLDRILIEVPEMLDRREPYARIDEPRTASRPARGVWIETSSTSRFT